MSDLPSYGSYGGQEPAQPGPTGPKVKPKSVITAVNLIWASVALSVVSSILSFVLLDDLVDESLEGSGVSADTLRGSIIVGLVIGLILSVVFAAVFGYFIGQGANWARIVYTVLAGIGLVFGLFGIGGQPPLLLVLSLIGYGLTIAILFLLYQKDSNAYFSS